MSPGRAWSALTICRPLLPALAFWTQVDTAAQPPPGILCPACSSDHVTKLAHHGLPGPTFAAARYWSTIWPVLSWLASCTPSWLCAICSAEAPSGLPSPGAVAASAVGSIAPGTVAGLGASAVAGPAAWPDGTAMNDPVALLPAPAAASCAVTAKNDCVEGPFGAAAAASAAAGVPGVTGAAATAAAGAPGVTAAGAAATGAAAGAVAGAAGAGASAVTPP